MGKKSGVRLLGELINLSVLPAPLACICERKASSHQANVMAPTRLSPGHACGHPCPCEALPWTILDQCCEKAC